MTICGGGGADGRRMSTGGTGTSSQSLRAEGAEGSTGDPARSVALFEEPPEIKDETTCYLNFIKI